MSDALVPVGRRVAGWPVAVALVLLVWAAGLPVAYLLILLTLVVWHLALPVLLVGWAAVSIGLTIAVRRRARSTEPAPDAVGRAGFGTLPQRAALLMNVVLLVTGPIVVAAVAIGGTGFSLTRGAEPGLVVVVVWGFVLLAATVPGGVLNGLWSLDRRTAAHEGAVLRGAAPGARRIVRLARTVAWVTWIGYGTLAVVLLVAALRGAF